MLLMTGGGVDPALAPAVFRGGSEAGFVGMFSRACAAAVGIALHQVSDSAAPKTRP